MLSPITSLAAAGGGFDPVSNGVLGALAGLNVLKRAYKHLPPMFSKGGRLGSNFGRTRRSRLGRYSAYPRARRFGRTRGYGRKTYVKKKTSKIRTLAKEVKNLQRKSKIGRGVMTYRELGATTARASGNSQAVLEWSPVTTSKCELILAQCKFFNPAFPSALITASEVAGTYQRDSHFSKIFMTATVRNSYQTGLTLKVYLCTCKDDTSISPASAWQQGMPDFSNLSPDLALLGTYPTDSSLAKDLWNWKVVKTTHLLPGASVTVSHTCKPFGFDASTSDSHALIYQNEWAKSPVFVFVIQGDVGHDTAISSEQTVLPCGIDVQQKVTYVVDYNAGIDLKFVHVQNEMDTSFTTLGVEGMKVTDNQSYSVS